MYYICKKNKTMKTRKKYPIESHYNIVYEGNRMILNCKSGLTIEEKDEILRLKYPHTIKEISKITGKSIETVKWIIDTRGFSYWRSRPKPSRCSYIIPEHKQRVLSLREQKYSYKKIADHLGITVYTVKWICNESLNNGKIQK